MEVRDLGLEVQGVGVKSRGPWKREGCAKMAKYLDGRPLGPKVLCRYVDTKDKGR